MARALIYATSELRGFCPPYLITMPHSTEDVALTQQHMTLRPSSDDAAAENDERVVIKNRRKRYLDLHPEYFEDADLELAGLSLFHIS